MPRQGHNTPLPLKRSPPGSFKRLLGGGQLTRLIQTAGDETGDPRTEDPKCRAAHQIEHRNRPPLPGIGPPTQLVEDETETAHNEPDRDHAYQDGRDLAKVRGLLRYVIHRSLFPPPNGSRLSCGRPARRRKAVGRKSLPCQGHNTPLPLERLAPASFKRLLGGGSLDDWSLKAPSEAEGPV